MVTWTYNLLFLIVGLILIIILTHFLAKFFHLLKPLLTNIIITFGMASAFLFFYIFSEKLAQKMDRDLYEKMRLPEYQVHILPKKTPWAKEVRICFKNNDTNTHIEVNIESKLTADDIYSKIKDLQPHISEVLKYP